mgnify:CR=1 FL=1
MFNINDITRGLFGRAALMRRSGSDPSPVPLPADIDLTADTLDSRVSYTGPAHAYLDSSGGVSPAAANAWPLEYLNGVAIGRHEPEKASSNIVTDMRFTTNSASTPAWRYMGSGVLSPTPSSAVDGGVGFKATNTYNKPAIYDGATFILPDTAPWIDRTLNPVWIRRRVSAVFSAASSAARFYFARLDSSNYVYFSNAAPAGAVVMSVFSRSVTGESNIIISLPQAEPGTIATSPILSGTTRSASSVTVSKDGDTDGVMVHFNTGDSVQLPFGSAASVALPLSAVDWAARYITRISYYQEG